MSCREGHPPRHPDFEPGNQLSVKAGHRSERYVQPIADELLSAAVEDSPWLAAPRYAAAVRAWARAEAQAQLLTDYLEQRGLHDDDGHLRPAEQALHRAETRAANLRTALGLTPLARARLGRDVAEARVPLTVQLAAYRAAQGGGGDV